MSGQQTETVGGGWLGTFVYEGSQRRMPPVRFEATLSAPDAEGRFAGTILDEEDGGQGEADVAGGQSGLGVRFSKVYRAGTSAAFSATVFYEGTLAEGGRTMAGTWRIADSARGVWDARRVWSEAQSESKAEDADLLTLERDFPREVVRLGG